MSKYYSHNKVMSYNTPFIFTLGTRSIGKTFDYTEYVIDRWLKKSRKFIIVRRYKEHLKAIGSKFFDNNMFKHPELSFKADSFSSAEGGKFYINGEQCGMAVGLNSATLYKGISAADYDTIWFDEFLNEDDDYLKDEVGKCFNLYQSVARGYGNAFRPEVKFIFTANHVSMNNPYFRELHIRDQYRLGSKYTVDKDRAWVLEMTDSPEITSEILNTPFGKMIAKTKYGEYSLKSAFYLDDPTFVEKPQGESGYVCTLAWGGKTFGVYEYEDAGLIYISHNVDKNCKDKFSLTTADHKPNYTMLYRASSNPIYQYMRFAYDNALLRFQDDECKYMFMEFMSFMD